MLADMRPRTQIISRLDYCQYLLVSQVNYTVTNFAEHSEKFSHDALNRYLAGDRLTPRLIWEHVREDAVQSSKGFVIFDDTVLDKRHSHRIELTRSQYSGNAHAVIRGVGIVNCVYVNPETDQFWIIDYRIYDPDGDGKSKLDHVKDMLSHCIHQKQLKFPGVLMDTWYAAKDIMLTIEGYGKIYCCPLKSNRNVDDSGGSEPYQRVDSLAWTAAEKQHGKLIKIRGFPRDHKVKLFRVVLSPKRTEYVVTNDMTFDSTQAVRKVSGFRWKVEQFHRETKQLTGLEGCQCRKARIVRNHVACAVLVWIRLKQLAEKTSRSIYRLKRGLLSDYLRRQLKSPAIQMNFA